MITLCKLKTGDTLSVRQGISKNPTADAIVTVKRPRPPSLRRSSQHRPVAQAGAVTTENKAKATRLERGVIMPLCTRHGCSHGKS